ncbi:MAG TPA: hypothetical protein VGD62_05125, partial [Acidobacteriaceae bacterium]
DRARLDVYQDALKKVDDPARIKDTTTMLGRSLALKVDQQCFDRTTEQQAPCLMQNQDQMILDNGRSQTIASQLTNGPTGDLALQASSAPPSNFGYYNAYIAAGMDIARILDSLHTAQYQYIPALASEDDLTMKLRLNTPPSFHNPKSVMVIALPPVEPPVPPPLRPVDPKQALCMQREPLVLPVEGAPAFFSTQFAHGVTLHLEGKNGKSLDLPAKADAARGGFAVPAQTITGGDLGTEVKATVHGFWGFEPYTGPTFRLDSTQEANWSVAAADSNALVVGREDELHLTSAAAACVDEVSFRDAQGKEAKAEWKLTKPDEITAKLPLKDAQPGQVVVSITQAGTHEVRTLSVASFSEAGKLDGFSTHAGDRTGTLKGTRLDEVASLTLRETSFTPGKLTRSGSTDELVLEAAPAAKPGKPPAPLRAGERLTAQVTLKDGRHLEVPVTIEAARPQVAVLNKTVQLPGAPGSAQAGPQPPHIQLAAQDELPLDGKLTFALKSQTPATFARGESVEIATEDGMASVTLSLSSGQLVLQDAKTAIGTLDPMKSFGSSAFGLLQVRPVMADGSTGDWQRLAMLVRLPALTSLTCPQDPAANCELAGNSLFLINAVGADPQFSKSISVPDGFAGGSLEIPHIPGGDLYLKLRDNPGVVNRVELDPAQKPGRRPAAAAHRQDAASPSAAPVTEPTATNASGPATETSAPGATSAPAAAGAEAAPPPAPSPAGTSPAPPASGSNAPH